MLHWHYRGTPVKSVQPLSNGKVINGSVGRITGFQAMKTPTMQSHLRGIISNLRTPRKPTLAELQAKAAVVFGVAGPVTLNTVWMVPKAEFEDPNTGSMRSVLLNLEVSEVFTQQGQRWVCTR